MSNGHRIRAVGEPTATEGTKAADQATPLEEKDNGVEGEARGESDELDLGGFDIEEQQAQPHRSMNWVLPGLAISVIALWTAFYGYALRAELASAANVPPSQWARWTIDWSVPVLLVCVIWILAMRNSQREAKRFAQGAALLSQESRELESRLTVVNRELSLAREFLGSQSRELESLGRMAAERLSTHAAELQQLIAHNSEDVQAIGAASETALANMSRLRDDLPVLANSARDVSNQIGNAGRTAGDQLDMLAGGFERLSELGASSETQVHALDARIRQLIENCGEQLDGIGALVADRFESVNEKAGAARAELEDCETRALAALSERMEQLETDAQALSAKLRAAEIEAMQRLNQARQRFEGDINGTIETLGKLDAKAVEAARMRITELNEEASRLDERLSARDRAFLEEVAKRQEEFATREAQATEILSQRLAGLDDALSERRETQTREAERLVEQSRAMSAQLDDLSNLIQTVGREGSAARESLSIGLSSLEEKLEAKRAALLETETQIASLTEASVRLLEIIQSGARHSREDLPKAIESASNNLEAVEARTTALSGAMLKMGQQGSELSDYLVTTQAQIEMADRSIEELGGRLSENTDDVLAKLQGLRTGFAKLTEDSQTFAGETQEKLREALAQLEDATRTVFSALENGSRERVETLAETLSAQAVNELERALRNQSEEAVGKLEQAAAHASGVGREATAQLRDQLAKVNELTVNLEQRVARAREKAEEQTGNDFARRMALITDSLNSNAIDIASALSTEVTDTSWDAYLKGDRGIFTRRAVRLVENSEAREIAELYQRDSAFKANVSRYIHDFEGMLRVMLSTRDGNALGVTILGSDMGKLYVALAQSIERFRN